MLAAALCAVALPGLFVNAQFQRPGNPRPVSSPRQQPDLDRLVRKYELVNLGAPDAARQARLTGRLSFRTEERTYELELEPHDMRADNYYAVEIGADGVERQVESGPVRTFKGRVRGMAGAQARFTIDDGALEGMIITAGERYFIEPRGKYSAEAEASEFVFYKSSDVNEDATGLGGTLDYEVRHEAEGLARKVEAANISVAPATTMRDVQLATDADAEYVAALGGTAAAANAEILSIMNQVEGVYQTQLGISFTIVHQNAHLNAATDPYTTNNPGGCYNSTLCGTGYTGPIVPKGLLNEFGEWWNANKAGVQRDLAHLWTGKDVAGSTVGLAWIGIVCRNPAYSYGFSQRITSLPGKYILTAHEIGHNFNAAHSDAQTGCASTIMGSSVGTGFTFCAFSVNQINTYENANAACHAGCTYAASPVTKSVPATAAAYNYALTADAGCAWTATSNQPWLTLAAGSGSGTGGKTIAYNVAANTGATSRVGVITVGGERHTVTQAGTPVVTLSIKGKITLGTTNLAGVTVRLTGSKVATLTTNSLGEYTFTGLTPGGSYTVTPWRLGYAFTPVSRVYSGLTTSQTTANFAARLQNYAITGRVLVPGTTVGVAGVTVGLSGSRIANATTNSLGDYTFTNLPAGGNYTVRPSHVHYTFSPVSRSFTNLSANQPIGAATNFTAALKTFNISGKVTRPDNLTGIYLVAVTITSPTPAVFTARTVNTSTSGGYIFTGLPAGRNYTITPRKTGFTFTPVSRTLLNLSATLPVGPTSSFTSTQ